MRSRIKSAEINDIIMNLEEDLPKDVINIINFIAHKVGAPSYRKTPNFKKQHNNKEVKLETSREIEQRIEAPKFSTSHAVLQADLVKLLTISEGRRVI